MYIILYSQKKKKTPGKLIIEKNTYKNTKTTLLFFLLHNASLICNLSQFQIQYCPSQVVGSENTCQISAATTQSTVEETPPFSQINTAIQMISSINTTHQGNSSVLELLR